MTPHLPGGGPKISRPPPRLTPSEFGGGGTGARSRSLIASGIKLISGKWDAGVRLGFGIFLEWEMFSDATFDGGRDESCVCRQLRRSAIVLGTGKQL